MSQVQILSPRPINQRLIFLIACCRIACGSWGLTGDSVRPPRFSELQSPDFEGNSGQRDQSSLQALRQLGVAPISAFLPPLTQRDRLRLDGVVGSSATAAKPVPTSLKANSPHCGDYRSVIVDERSMPTEELLAALIGQCQRTDDVRHLRAR